MSKKKSVLAWHFLSDDGLTQYNDRVKVEIGQKLTVPEPIALCEKGLHASLRAIDALKFAPGAIICRVRLSGAIKHGDDKLVATERTVIAMANATTLLHKFSCWVVEQALLAERKAGREPHADSWKVLKVKELWIDKKATDEELSAAESAARSAQNKELEERLFKLLQITPKTSKPKKVTL